MITHPRLMMDALASLTPNSIFAALKRSDKRGFFHWMVCLREDAETTYKFHATTDGTSADWQYECAQWGDEDIPLAVSFTKIGEVPDGLDHRHLDEYLRGIPMSIPKVDDTREDLFTCHVWFREAVRQLPDSGIFVECYDINSLEDELKNRATAAEYLGRLPQIYETKLAGPW